jgi:predicted metal-binding protein
MSDYSQGVVPRRVYDAPILDVCVLCRSPDWSLSEGARPGAVLAQQVDRALAARALPPAVRRNVRCISQCKRACAVAFSAPGRFTYLFGDLVALRDAAAIADAFALYAARPDGFMERFERPAALRAGILARIPPPGWTGPLIDASVSLEAVFGDAK